MTTSTVTTGGQIILPDDVLEALKLAAGDQIDFVQTPGGYKIVPLRADLRTLQGKFANRVSKPVSIREIDKAIVEGIGRIPANDRD